MSYGLQPDGLDFLAEQLCAGHFLALGRTSPLAIGYRNYNDVEIVWGGNASTDSRTAAMTSNGGVIRNVNRFYFPDADDVTGESNDGWGTLTTLFIVRHKTTGGVTEQIVLYANPLNAPGGVSIPQDARPKFEIGSASQGVQITLTAVVGGD